MSEVYAKIVNGWPIEVRDVDWPERNHIFESEDAYRQYCEENFASRPVVETLPPEVSEMDVWMEKLSGGWTDPVTKIKLKTSESARNLFAGQVIMIREALDMGTLANDTLMPIWDYYEESHTLAVGAIRGLLVRYGFAWQQMFNQYAP